MKNASYEYTEDYYERGLELGISGYTNYSWLPELTIRMAFKIAKHLDLFDKIVLDYGCAKGYLVKAFRLLDIKSYGTDISEYAISKSPNDISKYLYLNNRIELKDLIKEKSINTIIAKDVFEHLTEETLNNLLVEVKSSQASEIFVVVPLSSTDDSKYIVPNYENDKTHILRKSKAWWEDRLSRKTGFKIKDSEYKVDGVKDNWTLKYPKGNLFVTLQR